jgi:hypothetical protein
MYYVTTNLTPEYDTATHANGEFPDLASSHEDFRLALSATFASVAALGWPAMSFFRCWNGNSLRYHHVASVPAIYTRTMHQLTTPNGRPRESHRREGDLLVL